MSLRIWVVLEVSVRRRCTHIDGDLKQKSHQGRFLYKRAASMLPKHATTLSDLSVQYIRRITKNHTQPETCRFGVELTSKQIFVNTVDSSCVRFTAFLQPNPHKSSCERLDLQPYKSNRILIRS